jgi:hypothetical protein
VAELPRRQSGNSGSHEPLAGSVRTVWQSLRGGATTERVFVVVARLILARAMSDRALARFL